jgi:hypothetical protein
LLPEQPSSLELEQSSKACNVNNGRGAESLFGYNAPIGKMKTKNIKPLWIAACISMVVGTRCGGAEGLALPVSPTKGEYLRIADEVEANLQKHILGKFFPTAADEKGGGFFENYGLDWTRQPGDAKSIVYQSRLTWTSAQAAQRFPAKADMYLAMTRRGAAFLAEKMWDKEGGGFFWTVRRDGQPTDAAKQMYGHAFGIAGSPIDSTYRNGLGLPPQSCL